MSTLEGMFAEDAFSKALKEFDNPDLLEYEFFIESMDVKIYRKFIPTSGLYEYKVFGGLDCHGETCQQVYMDLEYRKVWDTYVAELSELSIDGKQVIYWNVKYPFPLSNRDYVYKRDCKSMSHNGKKTWVILAKSYNTESIATKKKVIRVNDFHQFMVMQEDGENKTRAFMHYYDNPKGMIPTWLINWAAKTGIPSFLKSMKDACQSYSDYKRNSTKGS